MTPAVATDWSSALLVLGVGLAVGAVVVWRSVAGSRRAAAGAGSPPVLLRDLGAHRDVLLRQLRELEDTASKRSPEQLARERYALELDAARVLLELDEQGAPAAAMAQAKASSPRARRAGRRDRARSAGMRGFLWGIGSAAAVAMLGAFVYQSARPRDPGGSVTGELPSRGGPSRDAPAADQDEAGIKAAIARDPNDVEARLALANVLLIRRDYMGAWNETTQVLERQPSHPRALAYQAVVRLAMGQTATAADLLRRALSSDPDFAEAWVYLALSYTRMGRRDDARSAIGEASRRFPDRAADFQRLLADLQTEAPSDASASSASDADPHARLATPGEARPGAAVARAPSVRGIAGTVDLDPALKRGAAPTGVLFVFVRAAGETAGPPIAVKRLPPRFPAAFELSEADSMMGQPFPDPMLIEARLDEDGDPTTRAPTDPKARLDGVRAGRSDVRLVLKRP